MLVDAGTVAADRNVFSAVALGWRHEPDAAIAGLIVILAHECRHPGASLPGAAKWPAWVIRPVFHGAEHRLRIGVVVADPRSGEGTEHTQFGQPGLEGGGPHGIAVVGTGDQRLGPALADPLPQTGAADEISGDLGLFPLGHVPGQHLAAPDVDHR